LLFTGKLFAVYRWSRMWQRRAVQATDRQVHWMGSPSCWWPSATRVQQQWGH